MNRKWGLIKTLNRITKQYSIRATSKHHCFREDGTSLCHKYNLKTHKAQLVVLQDIELSKMDKESLLCDRCYRIVQDAIKDSEMDLEPIKSTLKDKKDYSRLEPMLGQVVKHHSGRTYKVLGVSIHTENKEKLVIYQGLYTGSLPKAKPIDLFLRESTLINSKQRYEFELLDK